MREPAAKAGQSSAEPMLTMGSFLEMAAFVFAATDWLDARDWLGAEIYIVLLV